MGHMHPGAGIGGTRSARGKADAGTTCEFAVCISGHRGTAFLPAGDKTDVRLAPIERVEHGQVAFSGHPEGGCCPLGNKQVDKVVGGADRGVRTGHSEQGLL